VVLFNISFLAILVVIYIFNKQNTFDLKSNQSYSGASAFCFTAFIMAIKFSVVPKFGWVQNTLGKNYPMVLILFGC